jgi:2-iminobutanoate/2-iminopropanoate deaminase
MSRAVFSPSAPRPIGPYSQAIRAGELLFLSGQIPLSPATGEVVGETAAEQARQVLRNLGAVLEAAGAAPSDVVKTTIFLVDLSEFAAVNEVYAAFFDGAEPPARSTVQVSALPKGVRVEIEAVAHIRRQQP